MLLESFLLPNAAIRGGSIVTATSILTPTLQSGVQYWIAAATPNLVTGQIGWLMNTTGATVLRVDQRAGSAAWTSGGTTLPAFRVVADVAAPEPGPFGLVAVGVALIGLRSIRKAEA